MNQVRSRAVVAGALAVGFAIAVTGCTTKAKTEAAAGAIAVSSTNDACKLSEPTAKSGTVNFDVKNDGSQVTEFYLLAGDGLRVVGEMENIGPGITRRLLVTAAPGEYVTVCKPGMVGDGIRAKFVVEDSGASLVPTGEYAEQLKTATDQYAAFVRSETDSLVTKTATFVEAYLGGDDDAARASYASTRMHWERIEPVAESFGDLDPKMDLREADLEAGQTWTGWHRIEKDLWPPASGYTPMSPAERKSVGEQLQADTNELSKRIATMTYTPDQLGNGAKELFDEVATGKVTGEEEIWSGTDLWDFQANLEGAKIAFEVLEPVVTSKDKALADDLTARFAAVQSALDQHRDGDGFVNYRDLGPEQVKSLADVVNAISEPLSKLTAAVVG